MADKKQETITGKDGTTVPLNTWIEENGEKVMYTRVTKVPICPAGSHQFNRWHECMKCPFVFAGFRSNLHVQNKDGIFERKPGNVLGKRLA